MSLRNTRPTLGRLPTTPPARASILLSTGCLIGALLCASTATAQAPTTVQLPTFHEFSVSTTVVVPDRGGMLLGGVSSSSQSSLSRGVPGASKIPGAGRLFGNRAIGRETSTSTASVHAWIHNLDELDAATLAAARRDGDPAIRSLDAAIERKAAFLAKNVGRPTVSRTGPARGASAPERTSQSPPALRWGTGDSRR